MYTGGSLQRSEEPRSEWATEPRPAGRASTDTNVQVFAEQGTEFGVGVQTKTSADRETECGVRVRAS